ncbi:MAG: ABC transporter ATP-binding protein [Proteobacteria bacterium]|nr:ABC transporter ATP-binding protein [Pseudomonadota bacterium]MBU1641602.1 ABC transporter ATP-binding protein [Pseudomonadota bacterium]
MIEARKLCKAYRVQGQSLPAAQDIDLVIHKGEMVSIVGHSGSGKTTLLSLLGGLTRPDSGQVLLDGMDIWSMGDDSLSELRNRKLGFIYQFASLIPTLSALDNICLPTAFGMVSGDIGGLALTLLEKVGLADKAGFYPSQLSGGQQRRVAIARAFINAPEVILADEPTGDLDEETEREVIDLFRQINKESATSFLIVTHNKDIAGRTDRRFTMKNGILSEMT